MHRQTSNKSIAATAVPKTEEAMRAEELAFIEELKAAALVWYKTASPGVDVVGAGFEQVALAAFGAPSSPSDLSLESVAARWETVCAMRKALRFKQSLRLKKIQAARQKVVGRTNDCYDYELRTVELISEQFDAWFADGGLWNFVKQLSSAAEAMFDIGDAVMGDESVEREKRLFLVAFCTRRHFGLVPPEQLEALDFLGEEVVANEGISALTTP